MKDEVYPNRWIDQIWGFGCYYIKSSKTSMGFQFDVWGAARPQDLGLLSSMGHGGAAACGGDGVMKRLLCVMKSCLGCFYELICTT